METSKLLPKKSVPAYAFVDHGRTGTHPSEVLDVAQLICAFPSQTFVTNHLKIASRKDVFKPQTVSS